MHVLFIPKWFPGRHDPQLGDFIRKQAQAVAARTRTSALVLVGHDEPFAHPCQEVREKNGLWELHVHYRRSRFPWPPARRALNAWIYLREARRGWRRVVRERGRPDITHAYIMVRPAAVAWWAERRFGIPFLISEQSSQYLDGAWAGRPASTKALARRLFARASAITAVSPWLGDALVEQGYCTNYDVVPNIVPGMDRPLPPAGRAGHFLVVADLVDGTKNVSGVIRAFRQARTERPDMRLDIIGDGPDRTMLEQLSEREGLNGHIYFMGRTGNSEVLDHMSTCGAVVVNSNVETFSVVTGEALALGRPVIATRCGGPVAFINAENGVLIEPGDEAGLAQAMLNVTRGHERFTPEAIRRGISDRFSAETVARAFMDIYTRILAHG